MLKKVILPLFLYIIGWIIALQFPQTNGLISPFPLYFEIIAIYLPLVFILFLIVTYYNTLDKE